MSLLFAPVDDRARRGHDRPRPYVIKPPADRRAHYLPGEELEFRIVVFGEALRLVPYVLVAVRRMAESGLGSTRARLAIRQVWSENQYTGRQDLVSEGITGRVASPGGVITASDVARRAAQWGGRIVRLRLRTPLRLVSGERLAGRMSFATLARRLFERLSALSEGYAGGALEAPFVDLLAHAEQIRVVEDETVWLDVDRYSGRQKRRLPMGGLVGEITFGGDWLPFREWLAWGELLHVGKYAVMGNGWIEVGVDDRERR